MHDLITDINKFIVNNTKKGKALPDKDLILSQLVKLETVNNLAEKLPEKKEITKITQIDKDASQLEVELEEFLSEKFVKPPPTPVVVKEEVIVEVPVEVPAAS